MIQTTITVPWPQAAGLISEESLPGRPNREHNYLIAKPNITDAIHNRQYRCKIGMTLLYGLAKLTKKNESNDSFKVIYNFLFFPGDMYIHLRERERNAIDGQCRVN